MQQATINLPSTNPLRALTGLARQIALPGEHAPERFPSFPALERTAVIGFTQPASWAVAANTSTHGFLARQATYPCWLDTLLPGTDSTPPNTVAWANWTAYLSNVITSTVPTINATYDFQGTNLYNYGSGTTSAAPSTSIGVTNSSGFSTWSIVGVDESLGPTPFTYIPPGFKLYVIAAGGGTFGSGATVTVNLERWLAPGLSDFPVGNALAVVGSNTGGMAAAVSSLGGCWIRPTSAVTNQASGGVPPQLAAYLLVTNGTGVYTGSAANPGSVAMSASIQTVSLLPVAVPTEFSTSAVPWQDTRVTASAALLTNVTQVLNKGGTVLGGRLSPNLKSPWLATVADITALHPAEKAYLPLETGMYTYCPPSSDMQNFMDYAQVVQATSGKIPLYRLDNAALVNHFYLLSTTAVSMALNVSWHFEFRTSSALFQIALSGLTLESLHAAQLVLAQAGFFFENPEHDSVLGKVIKSAKQIAPHLLSVAEMHPAARAAAGVLKGAMKVPLPRQMPSKMKTTTADGSGITRPRNAQPRPKPKKAKGKAKRK